VIIFGVDLNNDNHDQSVADLVSSSLWTDTSISTWLAYCIYKMYLKNLLLEQYVVFYKL